MSKTEYNLLHEAEPGGDVGMNEYKQIEKGETLETLGIADCWGIIIICEDKAIAYLGHFTRGYPEKTKVMLKDAEAEADGSAITAIIVGNNPVSFDSRSEILGVIVDGQNPKQFASKLRNRILSIPNSTVDTTHLYGAIDHETKNSFFTYDLKVQIDSGGEISYGIQTSVQGEDQEGWQ